MDLETCRSLAGHPSHRVCVKVGVVTSCEVQLWVSICKFALILDPFFNRNIYGS